jgi:hypothetical protein
MTAPERIALRWEPGAAVTNGPLMTHPDYTRYVREDVAKPRVKPLVWREDGPEWPNCFHAVTNVGRYEIGPYNKGTFSCHVEPQMRDIGLSFLSPDDAKTAAQADYEARILSALVLP